MEPSPALKILFIINPGSGSKKEPDWQDVIQNFFKQLSYQIDFLILKGEDAASSIKNAIKEISPQKVVAVGGDGTISLVAEQISASGIPLGIIPAGSANGMAAELNIPADATKALEIIMNGKEKKCDLIRINETDFSIHLSDLGLNARLVKYFDKSAIRGMWGYARMLLKILIQGKPVKSHIIADNIDINISAYMIVIANATKYGTGAVINPDGAVDDGKFELVVVRQISFIEFIKMFLRKTPFNPKKVEIFQTAKAKITTKRKINFQVDGEYIGKLDKVTAEIIPAALNLIVPK